MQVRPLEGAFVALARSAFDQAQLSAAGQDKDREYYPQISQMTQISLQSIVRQYYGNSSHPVSQPGALIPPSPHRQQVNLRHLRNLRIALILVAC